MDGFPAVCPVVVNDQVMGNTKEPGCKGTLNRVINMATAKGAFKGRSGKIFRCFPAGHLATNVGIKPGMMGIKQGSKIQGGCSPTPGSPPLVKTGSINFSPIAYVWQTLSLGPSERLQYIAWGKKWKYTLTRPLFLFKT